MNGAPPDKPWTTGAPPGSIKMFNTSGMNRESPGRTGNDLPWHLEQPGLYREQPGTAP
ncbi:hypothetical protein DPMN_045577 [Dreissena polymorpha]|uniref:Uncharacterized protein n=1 Tax=Dreissena polymorpha TaxID=45954 RepID=A0A9D4D6L3_DREPO|nr:hypothetical protein DPMN_045577 [Dreissena polymorpha]